MSIATPALALIRASQLLLITMDMSHEAAKETVFVPSPQCPGPPLIAMAIADNRL
jgi:hypothetical protein